MGRPNSLIFMHPTRSLMDKRGQQIFMPRPNSMMNAIKGKEVYKALMRTKVRNTNCHYWENTVSSSGEDLLVISKDIGHKEPYYNTKILIFRLVITIQLTKISNDNNIDSFWCLL